MSMPQVKRKYLPLAEERRRFQRVKINLLGRYMLADRSEFPCQVINMSPGGMALIAPVTGKPGERVISYIDHLGRIEGKIARTFENGFAMTIAASARKRDKLAAQLTWLANRHILNPLARLILPNGNNVSCRIIDLSQSGAAIAVAPELRPDVGAVVTVGKTQGRVVRHIDDGFAIEFTRLQHPDFLEESVTGQ
jgi:hypothetical protein